MLSGIMFVTLMLLALGQSTRRRPPRRSAVRMRDLALQINAQVRDLVEQGDEELVPRDDDPETAAIRLSVVNGTAVIERLGYDHDGTIRSVIRTFLIRPNGAVERRIWGCGLLPEDRSWCHNQLTEQRLEYLLFVLTDEHAYSPPAR